MRRYFMANGPLGGNMGTPPVAPQPPQVSFTTTAESRGGFNNFLKSMPNTTALTPPPPPMGSSPMLPMANPMGNIDIFNQPPSTGMGMMGMNQPPMNPMMQPPMMGGLMGKPVQNFYNGGGVDDFGDFSSVGDDAPSVDDGGGFDYSDDDNYETYSSPSSFNEQNFQNALDNLNLGSDDKAFEDDSAFRGVNVGLENTGNFTTGVLPGSRDERFARFYNNDYAQRGIGRDFQTKIGNNPNLTAGDYFETFTPSSENPGGTGNRMAEFTTATGKGPNDILSINDMNNIMDIQGKYEAGIRNNPAGQIEKISTTVPMDNSKDVANVLANLDLSKDLALDKVPNVNANTLPPPSDYEENVGTSGALRQGDRIVAPGSGINFQYTTKGTTPKEQAELRELRDIDDAEFAPTTTDIFSPSASDFANFQSTRDQLPNNVDGFAIQPTFQNFGLPGANLPTIGSARSTVAQDQAKALANLVGDRDQTIGEKLQQNILEERGRALGPTTFRDDAADVTFENIRGQTPTTDTVFDIDTTDTRNFVGDDFAPALTLSDRNEADRLASGQSMGVGTPPLDATNITETALGGRSQNATRSTLPEDYEENVGRAFDANRMADIERLYNLNVGQTKAGKGTDPRFFEGLGLPSIATTIGDFIERKSRENMANEIALGRPMGLGETLFGFNANPAKNMEEYMANTQKNVLNEAGDSETVSRRIPESQLVRNDSGRIIGIYNEKGRLVSGYDPDAPVDTGDDNDSNPLILRRIAKEKEEEKEDKTPNVFGGGQTTTTEPKSVVVDSPFTTNVGDYSPTGFDGGDLNDLIARLLKTSNPKKVAQGGVIGYQGGGRVMQALDNLLATG